jgi:ethanolamine utilization protein EutN
MFLGRITGSLVATQKVESMIGQKLLVVEPLRVNEKDQSDLVPTGRTFVAVDTVGAGEGEIVLCVQGSSARLTPETKQLPIDAAVIGIVDRVQVGPNTVFSARATSSRT